MRMMLNPLPSSMEFEGMDDNPVDIDMLSRLEVCEPRDLMAQIGVSLASKTTGRLRIIANNPECISVWEHEQFSACEAYIPPLSAHQIVLHRKAGSPFRTFLDGVHRSRVVQANEISAVPAHKAIYFMASSSFHTLHITLSPRFVQNTLRNSDIAIDPRMQLGTCYATHDSVAVNLILAMVEYATTSHWQSLGSMGSALVLHLLEKYGVASKTRSVEVLTEDQLQIVRDFMLSRLGEIPKLEEITQLLQIGTIAFSRLFRSTTGLTPMGFYRDLRMQCARDLVERTRRSLTDIAMELGFTDAAHFSKTFNKYWKMPPSALRG